jgi:light-regulated signal transduction histidine kinase (bacteriophytochrome)
MTPTQGFHLACEAEQIHRPGAVQPHGTVIALSNDLHVSAVSANCEDLLGRSPRTLLGRPFADCFGSIAREGIEVAAARLRDGSERSVRMELPLPGVSRRLDCRAHQSGALVLLDLEPLDAAADALSDHLHEALSGLARLRHCVELEPITRGLADLIRRLTGFDRVMVYRFDADWHGEVVAESIAPGVPSYLGYHFPASDIPKQARELYVSAEVRHIPDARYTPSALLCADGLGPVDLGRSGLRSVSPAHLEYMRNMGVRASLVGSLLRDGKLWGLIACHQLHQSRFVAPAVRDLFHWICQDGATLVTKAKQHRLALREAELAASRGASSTGAAKSASTACCPVRWSTICWRWRRPTGSAGSRRMASGRQAWPRPGPP